MAPPTKRILEIFQPLSIQGRQSEFFSHVADDVHWTIMGHSPLSRTYTSKAEFVRQTLQLLGQEVLTEPLVLSVHNVISAGGEGEWAAIEMSADAVCRNGAKYDMVYNWVCQFDSDDKIVKVRAYLDTQLLTDAIVQNFSWVKAIDAVVS